MAIDMYLSAMKKNPPDALVLGCTHYPMLRNVISDYFGGKVEILDTAFYTAKKLAGILSENGMKNRGSIENDRFFVTDDPDSFKSTAELFLGYKVDNVFHI